MATTLYAFRFQNLFKSMPKKQVLLYVGNRKKIFETNARTVKQFLVSEGIHLTGNDIVIPSPSALIHNNMEVDLGIVKIVHRRINHVIKHAVQVEYTPHLNVDEIINIQDGRNGTEQMNSQCYYLNGTETIDRILNARWLVTPETEVVLEGTSLKHKLYHLSHRAVVSKIIWMRATAYYPGPEDTGNYAEDLTATDMRAGYGVAAIDPRFMRLNTKLYVRGYGYAIACDVGGAIKGNRIDLCFDSYRKALDFGRKTVEVYILR
jgi:3D (Asp-Asp-Asp) domain-containing protein